jgi:predicted Na+-dependent transporter
VTGSHALTVLFNAGIAISIGATVASSGMSCSVPELVAPLERVRLVVVIVVVNALVLPAVAWAIATTSPMASTYVPGLVLAASGLGSAGSLKAPS